MLPHIRFPLISQNVLWEDFSKNFPYTCILKLPPPPLWLNPTPRDHDFKQIWKDYLGMVPHNCQLYWQNRLWDLEKFYLKFSFVKIWTHPQLCPPPYSQGSWFQQIWIYTTWKKNQHKTLLAKWYWRRRYFKILPPPLPIVAQSYHLISRFDKF